MSSEGPSLSLTSAYNWVELGRHYDNKSGREQTATTAAPLLRYSTTQPDYQIRP